MSAVVFFVGYGTYLDDKMSMSGLDMGLWTFGFYVFTGLVVAANLRLAQEIKTWNWYMHVSLWGSILAWYLWGAVFAPVWPALKLGGDHRRRRDNAWLRFFFLKQTFLGEMYWVPYMAWANASYWLSVLLMCVISMIVTFTWTFVQRTYFPQDYHIIQEQDVIKRKVTLPDEVKPSSQLFAPQPSSSSLPYSGFAYEPGDEQRLSNIARKSQKVDQLEKGEWEAPARTKSPPVSSIATPKGPHDPSLERVGSKTPLVEDEMNL